MKKIIALFLIFIITLSSLFACNKNPDSNTPQTNNPPIPYSKELKAFEVYTMELMDTGALILEGFEPVYEKTYEITIKEENIQPQDFTIGKIQVHGRYKNTVSYIAVSGWRGTLTRIFNTDYGEIGVDRESNNIIHVKFNPKEIPSSDTDNTILSIDECRNIALSFLKTVNFPIDDKNYKFSERELIHRGVESYIYTFAKKIIGIDGIDDFHSNDSTSVIISNTGNILKFSSGDIIEENKLKSLDVDYQKIENSVKAFIDSTINEKKPYYTYQVMNATFFKLQDGTYAAGYFVHFYRNNNPYNERQGSVILMVPLEDGGIY